MPCGCPQEMNHEGGQHVQEEKKVFGNSWNKEALVMACCHLPHNITTFRVLSPGRHKRAQAKTATLLSLSLSLSLSLFIYYLFYYLLSLSLSLFSLLSSLSLSLYLLSLYLLSLSLSLSSLSLSLSPLSSLSLSVGEGQKGTPGRGTGRDLSVIHSYVKRKISLEA